jgi:hypothetical protein
MTPKTDTPRLIPLGGDDADSCANGFCIIPAPAQRLLPPTQQHRERPDTAGDVGAATPASSASLAKPRD